jgi:putative multiple sugar transport system substrate-binding protein
MPTQSSERWVKEGAFMVSELNRMGYDTILQFSEDIVGTQVSQIDSMLVRGIDVLIVCPIDGGALDSVLARVKKAGVLIIAYDRNLTDTQHVDYYITFDSLDIGNLMGQGVIDGLRASGRRAPWNVELFAGSLDDSNTIHYFEGGMEKLRPLIQSGDIVIRSGQTRLEQVATLAWAAELAQARMDNILATHYAGGQIVHGVLSPYDGLSIGIISSLRAVGYGTAARPWPAISGQDCELPSARAILKGEQYSTILLDLIALSRGAITIADEYMKGKPISVINKPNFYDNGVKVVPAFAIKAMSVTKDNIVREAVRIGHLSEEEILGN